MKVSELEVVIVDSKGLEKTYILNSKEADVWGVLRYNMVEKGSSVKPYSISYHPERYKDSKTLNWGCSCKGWIFHKKCKHISVVSNMVQSLSKVS